MKNLLIYISPDKDLTKTKLDGEADVLAKVQIDNSLSLGWKRKDILLAANFDYQYNGVKSLVVGDDNYCDFSPTASKINVIVDLFDKGMIGKDLYWFHDFDAFQLRKITEKELKLGKADLGITSYGPTTINPGRDNRWSTGTIFFKKSARDIFNLLKEEIYRYRANEEVVLLEILKKKRNKKIKERLKRMNITYNLATRKRDISRAYKVADKPLKVIHFHPFDKRPLDKENGNNNIAVCVYGRNRLNKVLVTKRLKNIFSYHKII